LKDSAKLINTIKKRFEGNPNFIFEKGIIPPNLFHNSRCMISDWSGISLEYAFTFERLVIFIDVPKKILNPNSIDISLVPIEISIRNKIGHIISPNDLDKSVQNINEQIREIRSKTVYNVEESAVVGAKYIQQLNEKFNSN